MTVVSSWRNTYVGAPAPARADVVMIGGGVTGLSAAFYLAPAARARGHTLQVVLIERSGRLGGKVRSEHVEHTGTFLVEGGPDSFVAQKPWAIELARDLGLGDQLIVPNPARVGTYLLWNGRPRPLPEGMLMIVPTRFMPFALSPLLSPLGKLRMALDLVIPARRDDQDETLAAFIRRRLGREALDRLAEPLMAGIHNAECERQSLLATFPRFRAIEQQHGSLIRGMLAQRRAHRPAPAAGGPNFAGSPFVTLRGGIGTLTEALAARFEGRLIGDRGVAALQRDPAGPARFRLTLDDGTQLAADAVILTTPAYTAAEIVQGDDAGLAAALRAIRYVSTATISLGYRQADLGRPIDGFGLVIPQRERRPINAVTFSSAKFADRAPEGYALLRVFTGGSRNPEALQLDDPALVAMVRRQLHAIFGITAEPLFTRLYRWDRGNPQYDVGHNQRIDALMARCPAGLHLAGAAYRGVGIPDCALQGRRAAEAVVEDFVALRRLAQAAEVPVPA